MTPTPNLWRIQSDLIELIEAREEAERAVQRAIVGPGGCSSNDAGELSPLQIAEEELEAIETGIQKYVAAKLVQVDELREPLIALSEGVELCKKRAAAETGRAMELQNRYDRLKDAIKQAMKFLEESGYWKPKQTRKVESPHGSFALKGNGGAQPVEITDEPLVPDEYCRVRVTMTLRAWKHICVAFNEDHELLEECNPGPREVSKSAIAEALNQDCTRCDGNGVVEPWGEPDEDADYRSGENPCKACGGSGKQGVPGARLLPRGESLVVR